MFAADPQIPWSLIVAVVTIIAGGLLSWVAYVAKQLVEHAKWMAAAAVQMDRAVELAHEAKAEVAELAARMGS